MNPFTDNTLSLEARGALVYAIAANLETITAQHLQEMGCGRERAYRILGELAGAGHLTRSKLGFRVTAFPTLLQFSPGEDGKSYGFSENPYILKNLNVKSTQKPVTLNAQEYPETRNSCTLPTTYSIESENHNQSVVDCTGESLKSYGFSENPTLLPEGSQLALVGCPEPLPPVAPVPSPVEPVKPPRPRNPPPPDEARALYAPMFELTKRVRSGKSAMGVYAKCAALWREFQATPEQVEAFWDWFKTFSVPAQYAAREHRPLNPPLPRQVHENWPQFLPWWKARQADLARRAELERRRQQTPEPDATPARRGLGYNPFKNKLTQPAPVLTAAASD